MQKELSDYLQTVETAEQVKVTNNSLQGLKMCSFAHGECQISLNDRQIINQIHEFNVRTIEEYKKYYLQVKKIEEKLEKIVKN